jgi:hypothetical protein
MRLLKLTTLVSQLRGADYTDRIVQATLTATQDERSRPTGIGATALALGALVLIYFIRSLLHFLSGTISAPLIFEQFLMCLGQGIEFLFIWHYWKGQDWGRIFVLLWSFVIAAREFSVLVDDGGDLAAFMSHPLRFLHTLLAIFLLYWLNTRSVRSWFKKMSATTADFIQQQLGGRLCTAVESSPGGAVPAWRLAFEHDAEFTLTCPWRIVLDDNLAFASNPGPGVVVDELEPQRLLQNLRVKAVRVTPRTSDLFITFEMGIELQTWSADPQAKQWRYSDSSLIVVADSVGLNSQTIAAPVPLEDSTTND